MTSGECRIRKIEVWSFGRRDLASAPLERWVHLAQIIAPPRLKKRATRRSLEFQIETPDYQGLKPRTTRPDKPLVLIPRVGGRVSPVDWRYYRSDVEHG